MERVAFLIEETHERLPCLLNPESLVMRRVAGVQSRQSATGQLTGAGLSDDPLLYTGGGRTELELDLLFDVAVAGSSITSEDVRDLTGRLWRLAENTSDRGDGYRRPPLVRFVWGKSWNIPGIITAVSEHLEHFTPEGVPRRSWLRLRLVRVNEEGSQAPASASPVDALAIAGGELAGAGSSELPGAGGPQQPAASVRVHETLAGGGEPGSGERLDVIAYIYLGSPALWRLIAIFNDVADPLRLPASLLLRIPSLSLRRRSP